MNLAEWSAATFIAALTRRSDAPLSYAADAAVLLEWRMAMAAAQPPFLERATLPEGAESDIKLKRGTGHGAEGAEG